MTSGHIKLRSALRSSIVAIVCRRKSIGRGSGQVASKEAGGRQPWQWRLGCRWLHGHRGPGRRRRVSAAERVRGLVASGEAGRLDGVRKLLTRAEGQSDVVLDT